MNKMTKAIFRWLIWILLVTPLVYIVWGLFPFVVLPIKNSMGRDRILDADHGSLLSACREVMLNCDKYKDQSNKDYYGLKDGEIAITIVSWSNDVPHEPSPPLPQAIRQLRPMALVIARDHLVIQPCNPPRSRIFAFDEGIVPGSFYTKNMRTLTNGLLYAE